MDGISEETKAEIKRKYGPHDKPPKNEAERVMAFTEEAIAGG